MIDAFFIPASATVRTPWMSRGADNAQIAFEVIDGGLSATASDNAVEHKNLEDAGEGAANDDFGASVGSGVTSETFTALKELVRLKLTAGASRALVRVFAPTWFNDPIPQP